MSRWPGATSCQKDESHEICHGGEACRGPHVQDAHCTPLRHATPPGVRVWSAEAKKDRHTPIVVLIPVRRLKREHLSFRGKLNGKDPTFNKCQVRDVASGSRLDVDLGDGWIHVMKVVAVTTAN